MAKIIQRLPQNVPNICALDSLGWSTIAAHIDYVRIMFLHRLLLLKSNIPHRAFVVRRLLYILLSGVYLSSSPLSMALEVYMKYGLLNVLLEWINGSVIPSKDTWKSFVKSKVRDVCHNNRRFELSLFPKLVIFRIVHTLTQPLCWWQLCKLYPFLKKPCCTMLRLLGGCNILAVNVKHECDRKLRICIHCDLNKVEDLEHFILYCTKFTDQRLSLWSQIQDNLSVELKSVWNGLSKYMKFLIIMGLDFPMLACDLNMIRYFACINVNNMYVKRRALEPP